MKNSCSPQLRASTVDAGPDQADRRHIHEVVTGAALLRLRGLRVLVVEDTWAIATALRSLFEDAGMVVAGPTADVGHAERLAAERPPQAAVVDLNLNGELAFELIGRLHQSGIPVVVVSGYATDLIHTAKAAAIVQKPFSEEKLLGTLCDVIAHSST